MERDILQFKCTGQEDSQRLASNTSPKDMLSSDWCTFIYPKEVTNEDL